MKRILMLSAVAGILLPCVAFADSRYSLMPVGDDTRIIRTADGAELGRLEYLILEPSSRRVVATVVTGGIVGNQEIVLPFKGVRFDGSKQVILTDVTRERVESAPPIQRVQLTTSGMLPASVVDGAFEHFGLQRNENALQGASAPTKHSRDQGEIPSEESPRQASRSKVKRTEASTDAALGDTGEEDAGASSSSRGAQKRRRG